MLELTVPDGAQPGAILGVITQRHPARRKVSEMVYIEVPDGCPAGTVFEARVPVYSYADGSGWTTPCVLEQILIPQPASSTSAELMAGFHGVEHLVAATPPAEWPLLVLRVPPPEPGDSLHSAFAERFNECDVRGYRRARRRAGFRARRARRGLSRRSRGLRRADALRRLLPCLDALSCPDALSAC